MWPRKRRSEASADGPDLATPPAVPQGGEAERLLHRMEWTVLRRLDGLLDGDHRTLLRGMGLDLADLREYQVHDDVRYIDWNVTARMQTPYVREFQQDREVSVWFVLDLSGSVDFGSGTVRKRDVLIQFVAVMARMLTQHGNRVGAVVYGNAVEDVMPPRAGRQNLLQLLHRLKARAAQGTPRAAAAASDAGDTALGALLQRAGGLIRRRSVIFVVSDFISAPGWAEPLGVLAQRHEVLAVRLVDPLERELPDLGIVLMEDAETGEQQLVDTHDRAFRRRFEAAADQREAQLRIAFGDAGVDAVELATDDDLVEALRRFIELRKLRLRGAAAAAVPA